MREYYSDILSSELPVCPKKMKLSTRIDDDIFLVTDGNNVYPPCAKSFGIKYEALGQSAGERVRGPSSHAQQTTDTEG